MPQLTFETLSFQEQENHLQVTLLKLFTTEIPKEELPEFSLPNPHTITFTKPKADHKFLLLLTKHFQHLKNKLTNNPVTYIHQASNIPLIGNVSFGIVYRNSTIIEIKPFTSCNLNCIYCSISEGLSSKKHDFVIEKDYLIQELKSLLKTIKEPVEIHIGVQGEPFLYADILPLIEDLQTIKQINTISVDTNGTLLNKLLIDQLAQNNKLQLNFSLDAINEEKAKQIAGVKHYNINHVKEMIAYAAEKINKVLVAPVFMQDYNKDDIEEIILFIKSLKKQPILGIQNFLRYKTGKNPTKALPWQDFYGLIHTLEQKHNIKLKLNKEDFNIKPLPALPKPFHAGKVISATLVCPDRFPNTSIAVFKNRTISVPDCKFSKEKQIRLKILKDKHNIFVGKIV